MNKITGILYLLFGLLIGNHFEANSQTPKFQS